MKRFDGTTILLGIVQLLGWLSIPVGLFLIFRSAISPYANEMGVGTIVSGVLMIALGSVGRIFVQVAEKYLNSADPHDGTGN